MDIHDTNDYQELPEQDISPEEQELLDELAAVTAQRDALADAVEKCALADNHETVVIIARAALKRAGR